MNDEEMLIYRPPNKGPAIAQKATLGVKFAQGVHFLDPWGFMLIGKTKWQRFVFKLQHPFAYFKRYLWKLRRRIRSIFIKDRMVPCIPRVWKNKEDLLNLYPEDILRFPQIIAYCEGMGEPEFSITIDRSHQDYFIDEKGQKWVKA